jgi:beta-carotene ketolase (CrtO type)
LALKIIGEDYVDPLVVKNIKRLEWGDSIFGIYLALNGPLEYKSGNDTVKSAQIHISDVSLEYLSKIFYECRSGKLPTNPLPIMSNDSIVDPSRVPANDTKHLIKFLPSPMSIYVAQKTILVQVFRWLVGEMPHR